MRSLTLKLVVVGASLVALITVACSSKATPTPMPTAMTDKGDTMMDKGTPAGDAMMEKLPDQQFAAHFVSSSPKHGDSLAAAPDKVSINFNFTLGAGSIISVKKDGAAMQNGPATIAQDKLSMSSTLPSGSGKGLYTVEYKACWPDGSCHNGLFAFNVPG